MTHVPKEQSNSITGRDQSGLQCATLRRFLGSEESKTCCEIFCPGLQRPNADVMHVGELPRDVPSSSGRESTAEALVADAVDEEEIDSVIRVPGFKHLVKHAVSHLAWRDLLSFRAWGLKLTVLVLSFLEGLMLKLALSARTFGQALCFPPSFYLINQSE